jgi:PAS domain S-box-containing protein
MAVPLRVLILEDRPADAELVVHELRRAGFEPDWRCVDSEADYLAHLDQAPDIILADYSLPQWDAPSALRALQERRLDIPFIMISGTVGEEEAVECMKQGADDYLLKDRLSRLGPAVTKALEDKRLRVEKQQAEAALRESEEKFRNLFNNAEIGMFRTKLDGSEILDANEKFLEIFGRTHEEVQGRPSAMHWADPREREDMVHRLEAEGRVTAFECRMLNKQGEVRTCLTSLRLVREQDILEGSILDITERKQAAEAIRLSEARYRSLVETQSDVMARSDLLGNLTFVNDAYCRAFGKSREELLGTSFVPTVLPEDAGIALAALEEIKHPPYRKSTETRHVTPAGVRWFSWENSAVVDEDGNIIELQGVGRDITERKQAEEALLASETRYRRLFEAARDGILILDADSGKVIDANPFLLDLLGYFQGELLGKELWEIGFFKDIAASQAAFGELQAASYIRYEDLPLETRDGRQVEVEFVSNVYMANGRQVIQCNIRDITERKQAEEALRAERDRAQTYLDIVSVILIALNTQGEITLINNMGCAILGYEERDLIGLNWFDNFVPEHAREQVKAHFYRLLEGATGEIFEPYENPIIAQSGAERMITWRSVLVRDAENRIIGTLGSGEDVTERRQAEQELRKLSQAVEHSPSIVYITGSNGRLEYVNPKFTEITGYTAEEAAGRLPRILDPDKTTREAYEERWSTIRSGGEWRGEFQNRKKNGDLLWESVSISSIKDENGAISHLVLVMEDITVRKQAEAALQASEERLRTVLENMPVMLDALDEDLNIIVWNRECERVTGYSADEIIHHPSVSELLYPDPAYRARIQGELVAGEDYRGWEWETTCKDGSVRTISWSNISRQCPVPGWAQWGIGVDITERKLAERKLLQWNDELEQRVTERTAELNHAKERIETILNSSSDVMILCRADGTIDQANPAFRETFGYTSDAIYNEPLAELITTENDVSRLEDTFETVVQTQHPMRLEITAYSPERPAFSADIVLSPVIGANDQLFGVVCSLRDNTARRKMEDKLRHMLEHEMELSELKSRYVSMAAHDLRNPLAVIRSAVDLIQRYGDRLTDEQIQTKYDHIQASINVMVSLLDDILTIGQVESGKLAFNPAPLDAITFCQDLSMEIGQAAGAARRIVFSGQGDCHDVLVDAKLLRHILGNLLSNAIKYSPEGRDVIFEVDCQPDRITFCVQDHGIGIPEEDQKHLFETFHRASNVRQIPGTGLGLAIVRQSVVLHGGTITFESEIGAGTTFTVVLPQAETPPSGDQAAGQQGTG